MTSKQDIAVQKFSSGFNCAQSVIAAFCGDMGLDESAALKLACGFGAGMGRKQEVCGAVTGGIMAVGLNYGNVRGEDQNAKEKTYASTRELMNRFGQKHGSYLCRELLGGCDLLTEKGQKHFKEIGLHDKVCKGCVKSAVEIAQAIIEEGVNNTV